MSLILSGVSLANRLLRRRGGSTDSKPTASPAPAPSGSSGSGDRFTPQSRADGLHPIASGAATRITQTTGASRPVAVEIVKQYQRDTASGNKSTSSVASFFQPGGPASYNRTTLAPPPAPPSVRPQSVFPPFVSGGGTGEGSGGTGTGTGTAIAIGAALLGLGLMQ